MAGHERGRSQLFAGDQANNIRHTTCASLDPSTSFTGAHGGSFAQRAFTTLNRTAASGAINGPSFTQDYSQDAKWSLGPTYTDFQQLQQPPIVPSQTSDIANHTFLQSTASSSKGYGGRRQGGSQRGQSSNHVSPSALTESNAPSDTRASSTFPSFGFNQTDVENGGSLDPSLLSDFDANPADLLSAQQSADSLNPMAATMQSHSPTPPHHLQDMTRQHSRSPSPQSSPHFQQASFRSMNRPRATSESLDPSSAMFLQGQSEWPSNMGVYRHRRTPSDQLSEYSGSYSNQASPYLQNLDSFDGNAHSSPLLNPSQDPTFNGDLGLQGFTINGDQQPSYISPAHSPHVSPRLAAQQSLPPFTAEDNYGLSASTTGLFGQLPNGLEMFPNASQEPFPALNHSSPGDIGAADQMSPPEINIDYAPPSQNPLPNMRPSNTEHTLSPPLGAQSRNRMRAKSDSYAGSRPASPGIAGRGRSPSLQPQTLNASDMLAPLDNRPPSRSPSPARGRNGSLGERARSSSHASDQRDYILDLANRERTPSNDPKGRGQKNPATFQCNLCPKRFTRAYNLRSHLRTHTDERPFICTVCGKAFARQHDRKRHEGLHSGEKKFVCRGNLQNGPQWGCGRRFARADALGRHFRSEAGRVCIKPLLDEEAAERQKAWMEEQQQSQVAAGLVAPQPMMAQPQVDMMGNFLPAALLQQYPALAGIDWSAVPQGPPPEDDYSGRSSFDASSGGEYYDDLSENEMGNAYPDPSMGGNMMNMNAMNNTGMNQAMNMAHAHPGAQFGGGGVYGGNQAADYLDFEGTQRY